MRLGKYLKKAFTNHWNLLLFFGAGAFSILSGRSDILLPFVLACEIAYLGMLGTHPKFQRYVDAEEAKATRVESSTRAEESLRRVLEGLPERSLKRYESLRARCLELRQIALSLKYPGKREVALSLEDLQLSGLDRLLWIYLRLLFTEHSLERFLEKTREDAIEADIRRLESRLAEHEGEAGGARREKVRQTLEDNLATCRERLANLRKAGENHELVKLEIDRLENKIRTLSELAINRQEPEFISTQIDHVTTSLLETERTMNELEFATGLAEPHEEVPELLERQGVEVRG